MRKFFNWKLFLILIILLAAFLRLWQLGNIPYGTTNDETFYIYNSYSIWHTAKDVQGRTLPFEFTTQALSPVPIYLTSPIVGILGLSLLSGRLLASILGVGSVILIFLFVDYLFKNKWIALLSALMLSISSWALQLDRTGLGANYTPFFYLLGAYIFIKNVRNVKYLWSLVPFVLGFYSYHATKVFFLFLVPFLIFTFRKELLVKKKLLGVFLTGVALIFISFYMVIKFDNVTRQSEVELFNGKLASNVVNIERNYNTAPHALRTIFSNKPLYYLRILRENYLGAFSIDFLFLGGEVGQRATISNIFYRGEFYIIELPFLLFGLYLLFTEKKLRFQRNFLIGLLLISITPSAFTIDKNFVDRDIMMLPFIITIISFGFYFLLQKILNLKKIYKILILTLIVFVYTFLFSEYLYQYYFRWPVYGAEAWNASSRDLVNFVAKNKNKFDNVIISNSGQLFLIQYATLEKVNPQVIQKIWNNKPLKLDNITMLDSCFNSNSSDIKNSLPKKTLYISSFASCNYSSTPSAKIVDRGEPLHTIWNIYETN